MISIFNVSAILTGVKHQTTHKNTQSRADVKREPLLRCIVGITQGRTHKVSCMRWNISTSEDVGCRYGSDQTHQVADMVWCGKLHAKRKKNTITHRIFSQSINPYSHIILYSINVWPISNHILDEFWARCWRGLPTPSWSAWSIKYKPQL